MYLLAYSRVFISVELLNMK